MLSMMVLQIMTTTLGWVHALEDSSTDSVQLLQEKLSIHRAVTYGGQPLESAHFPAAPATNTSKRRAYLEHLVPWLIDRALDDAQPKGTTSGNTSVWRTFGNEYFDRDPTNEYATCVGSRTPAMIIISMVAGLSKEYVSLLRANRMMVAEPFNYMYCDIGHSLDTDRDVSWSKIIAVRHFLSKQSKPVVGMDADAIFMTDKIAFEDYTDAKFKTKDILFTEDIMGGPVNAGVFVTKSTDWTRYFWQSIYEDFFPKWKDGTGENTWEQRAILEFREKHPYRWGVYTATEPCCEMNNVAEFSGKFIAHPAGGHGQPGWVAEKYGKLKSIMEKIVLPICSQKPVRPEWCP